MIGLVICNIRKWRLEGSFFALRMAITYCEALLLIESYAYCEVAKCLFLIEVPGLQKK
jgi:hypothetical protein